MITTLICAALLQEAGGGTLARVHSPELASERRSAPLPAEPVPVQVQSAEPAPDGAPIQSGVQTRYDVRALGLTSLTEDFGELDPAVRLVPSLDVLKPSVLDGSVPPGLVDESWINLVVDVLGRTVQGEGTRLDLTEQGWLRMRGNSGALHSSIEGLLGMLVKTSAAETQLLIETVALSADEARALAGALIPIEVAEELGRRASERFEVTLRGDMHGHYEQVKEIAIATGYSAEVAQRVAVSTPIIVRCAAGTRFSGLGAPARGGVHLSFVLKRTALTLAQREPWLDVNVRTVGDDGVAHTERSAAIVEDPVWTSTSFATSCFVPRGQALALLGSSGPERSELLLVRVLSSPEPVDGVKFEDGKYLSLLHLGAVEPPELVPRGMAFATNMRAQRSQRFEEDGVDFLAMTPRHYPHAVLRESIVQTLGRGYENWRVGPWLVVRGDERVKDLSVAVPTAGPGLEVDVTFRRGERTLRRARLSLRMGSSGAVALTDETLDMEQIEVEIAQASTVTRPVAIHVFDGLACWLRALPAGEGRLVLETAGAAQAMGPRRGRQMEDAFVNTLDQRELEHLNLRGRRTVTRGEDGVYRAILGAQAGDGLQVSIEIR